MSDGVRTACPVCGGARRPLPGSCPDSWICRACGHTFIGTLPTAETLAETYAKYSYADANARAKEMPAYLEEVLAGVVRSFESHRSTGRFLDVGFGDGGFLRVARRLGWDTHGVEFAADAIRAAETRDLGTLHAGDFRDLPLAVGSFDVIVMSELIEHLTDPDSALRRARELLRPGGVLYLTTPHGRGLSGRTLRASWSVLCPPEHLQLFSIASMRRSLRDAGFRRSSIYTQGILPHELVATLRVKLRGPDEAPVDRVGKSHELNAKFESGPAARSAKRAANALIRLSRLGDSLRARALR